MNKKNTMKIQKGNNKMQCNCTFNWFNCHYNHGSV